MNNIIPPIILALIIGLTQALKKAGLPTRFAPLVAVALGLCAVFLTEGVSGNSVILGLVVGLTSVGLFSGTRATLGK
jgi:hypothetical protein